MPSKPVVIREQVKYYYRHIEEYDWTRVANTFIGLETIFHRSRCKETVKLVKELSYGGRCLDVGCGTAMITRFLPVGSVGIDLNARNLKKAQQYAPHTRFVLCDAEGAIPVRDHSFDVVICTEMLEHLLYPLEALREIFRVLKPRGFLVGSVPGRSPIWKLRWMSMSRNSFKEEPYHKHYNREEVRKLLSQHFHVQKVYSKYFQMSWFFVAIKESL